MISKQVMQGTIDGIAAIAQLELHVFDMDGHTVVSAPQEQASAKPDEKTVRSFADSPADAQEIGDCQYYKIFGGDHLEYVLVVRGEGEHAHTLAKMTVFQIESLITAYRERYDRDNFIKNLLLDNLLLVDIYSRARELGISEEAKRVCLIIRPDGEREAGDMEQIRRMAAEVSGDIVTEIDERDVILVHEMADIPEESGEENPGFAAVQELKEYAQSLLQQLTERGLSGLHIAFGTVIQDLRDVSRSFKEAKMALDVSRIFYEDENVVSYSELGIGRLIYQLPLPLCRMFLSETFGGFRPDVLEPEIIQAVKVFFENSLNVSETARNLFVHRNTLVYRLDKIQKMTGLDIRVFEDAMTYRIAMMVVSYMKFMEENHY